MNTEVKNKETTEIKFYWGDYKLQEPIEKWSLLRCPKCKDLKVNTIVANKDTGKFHCEACGYKGDATKKPRTIDYTEIDFNEAGAWWNSTPITQKHMKWLENYYITEDLAKEIGLSITKQFFHQTQQVESALAIPSKDREGKVIDVQFVKIDSKSGLTDIVTSSAVGKGYPLGIGDINNENVYIVNNPKDYIAIKAVGIKSVICIPENLDTNDSSHDSWKFLSLIEPQLKDVSQFTFALPNDEKSLILEEELARRLDITRCQRTRWKEAEKGQKGSAFETFFLKTEEELLEVLDNAKPFPIEGIHTVDDFEDDIDDIYAHGFQPGKSTGFTQLDSYYTVKQSEWTLVTGIPSHGKSSFLDAVLINMAKMHGWTTAIFSPENQPVSRHYADLIQKASGKTMNKDVYDKKFYLPKDEYDKYKNFVRQYFKIVLPKEEGGNWSLKGILNLAAQSVYRYGAKIVVIDPWNEVEHQRPQGMNDIDYLSYSLTEIRRFARKYKVHVFIVAHPKIMLKDKDGKYLVPTPYDVSGGAHWNNKADNILTVYRNVGKIDQDITHLHIQKIRFRENGRVGVCFFRTHKITFSFIDDIDQDKMVQAIRSGVPVPSSELRLPEDSERKKEYVMEENEDALGIFSDKSNFLENL